MAERRNPYTEVATEMAESMWEYREAARKSKATPFGMKKGGVGDLRKALADTESLPDPVVARRQLIAQHGIEAVLRARPEV